MEHLISKDAVVAEIKRRLWLLVPKITFHPQRVELEKLLSFLDTLEVKEVDLEKELIEWHKEHFKKDGTFIVMSGFYLINSQIEIAKHFFELGMQVSNKAQNIWHDANEKLPTGVIVVSNGGNLHIGWSTDEGDGIEDEHGRLITKTYQKWAREEDLT